MFIKCGNSINEKSHYKHIKLKELKVISLRGALLKGSPSNDAKKSRKSNLETQKIIK